MRVKVQAVRDREPWGPGKWYAEVVDVLTRAVLFATDFGPRGLVLQVATAEAQRRGFRVEL